MYDPFVNEPGMLKRGNIDLLNRPVVKNPDGSISTVRSMNTNIDGQEVLLPTVINGKVVDPREAIKHYLKTGEHLGIFQDPQSAEQYAQNLHNEQARLYLPQKQGSQALQLLGGK